jgi:hypothetical protein
MFQTHKFLNIISKYDKKDQQGMAAFNERNPTRSINKSQWQGAQEDMKCMLLNVYDSARNMNVYDVSAKMKWLSCTIDKIKVPKALKKTDKVTNFHSSSTGNKFYILGFTS